MSNSPVQLNCNNFSTLPIREAVIARHEYQKYTQSDTAEWKPIPGFEDYTLSSSSIVKHEKSYGTKSRTLVQTIRNNRYFYITLTDLNEKRVGFPIDLLMIMTFHNIPREEIRKVIHLDGIKHNNQLKNLDYILW